MNTIKIVLIDADGSSLKRTSELLKKFPKIDLVAKFTNPKEGLDYLIINQVDLVILDIEMPVISGLKIAKEIKKQLLATKVIFYSEYKHYAIKAIKTGAFDYLLKPISIDELHTTLQRFQVDYKMNLNQRELQIIREMSEGLSSRSIGEKLFISKHTVDKYRRNILEKTSCQNAAELVKFASQVGII